LLFSGGFWQTAFDGKDGQGNYLANGSYVAEAESVGGGASHKVSANFSVIRAGGGLVKAVAWPNPAPKGSVLVSISWVPAALEVQGQIYDQAGELVVDLGLLKGGLARWDLKNASDGVYFVALRTPGDRRPRLVKVALAR